MDNNQTMESEQLAELFYTTKHFWKCYMKDFLKVMKSLSYKQFEIFIYILENVKPSTNLFIATPRKIEKNTKCCRQTVAKTMKILQEQDFIRKIQTGVWIINPDILIKGNDSKQKSCVKATRMPDVQRRLRRKTAKMTPANRRSIRKFVRIHARITLRT